jgi:hypothetical protein
MLVPPISKEEPMGRPASGVASVVVTGPLAPFAPALKACVLDINHLSVVTREVVEAARESLVIGVM